MSAQRRPYPAARTRIAQQSARTAPALIHPGFRRLPPPVIVIGMHRSGTSLVAALLHKLGLFLGPDALVPGDEGPDDHVRSTGYGESVAFRLVNERLLEQAGASWHTVEPFLERQDSPAFATRAVRGLQVATFTSLRQGFLPAALRQSPGAWGWKDPRNSLTLPYWLRLFPEARIIHVRRDPESVVRSLYQRATRFADQPPHIPAPMARAERALRHPVATGRAVLRRMGVLPTVTPLADPCLDPDYCRRLTDRYVRECEWFRGGGNPYLEVSYEALCGDPGSTVRELARFAGCAPGRGRLESAASFVRRGG